MLLLSIFRIDEWLQKHDRMLYTKEEYEELQRKHGDKSLPRIKDV
jgi:hypothetical protein